MHFYWEVISKTSDKDKKEYKLETREIKKNYRKKTLMKNMYKIRKTIFFVWYRRFYIHDFPLSLFNWIRCRVKNRENLKSIREFGRSFISKLIWSNFKRVENIKCWRLNVATSVGSLIDTSCTFKNIILTYNYVIM